MDDLVNGLEPAIDPTESFRDNVPAGFHTGLLLVLYYLDIPRVSQCLVAYAHYRCTESFGLDDTHTSSSVH